MAKRLSKLFTPHFQKVWALVKSRRFLKIVLKGGRGSAKSTHIAMMIILLMMMYPISFLVVRKVAKTLSDSVFEQLKEAIDMLEVNDKWRIKQSPMEMIYVPRGNKIVFRGADDPNKIKSIKVARFPLAGLWIEELAEFKTEEEVSTIEKSVLREELPPGLFYIFFYSYNPPKRKQNWVNKKFETQFTSKNTYVDHSTYLENPFISKAFIEEAEDTKARSEFKYRWEFMGEAIGSGVVPFNNLVFRTITDEEVAAFDNIRQGNDFGYANDPNAFVRWHYDKKRRTIYAIDEIFGVKMSIRELSRRIVEKGYNKQWITADSAEPRSIDELYEHGVSKVDAAKKGPDSVEYGEEWLDDLKAIVIDPERTPEIAREFENIDYQVDKDGNPRNRLEDKDNHTIDATRYAFEEDMHDKGISVITR
ncbi:PBSX family phage terminase large subunit [Listeria ilorinensis]|uniref:PBSX family phage terminase large subunit n=1 Tax=Listeria ilorinensis TaxID=2867439 RepID=UPI001EF65EB2|nr:PBSX family phage terminase large subunit [Listeria ilorinensis]